MEMPNQDLIELLIKYHGHFNYDDYTKIVNGGLFENEKVFIFIENEKKHKKMNKVIKHLLYKHPELIDIDLLELCFSSDGGTFYDIIDYDMLCEQFIIDELHTEKAEVILVIKK